ncbi:hypothetical protein, partial [Virgibacillus salexigens]|uniref:hypothetical protein n=1 Tax=Virgibacillus massiliensis TaxID=1462526 RepID=UPI001E63B801
FGNPPEAFKRVKYNADLLVSEANWHQLLRHNRKSNFIYSDPPPIHGFIIPPRIKEAGLSYILEGMHKKTMEIFHKVHESDINNKSLADYAVLNAHKR